MAVLVVVVVLEWMVLYLLAVMRDPPPSPSSPSSHSTYPSAPSPTSEEYDFPLPQEVPTYKPVDIIITKQDSLDSKGLKKNCIVCAASIPKQAKFCNKCGNSQ